MAEIIYLDNAATTFPKPREVLGSMIDLYAAKGVSPGRGGYDLALEADELVSDARRRLCQFFGGQDPDRVIFASNATDALNLVIHPTDKEIKEALSGNLCRCTGYVNIIKAVRAAAQQMVRCGGDP